jgi:hypothetical protein
VAPWQLAVAPPALTCLVFLGLTPTPTTPSGPATAYGKPVLVANDEVIGSGIQGGDNDGVALLMGGSGTPIPPEDLIQTAFDNYAVPKGFENYDLQAVFTPEGLSPIFSGVKSLPLDTSVDQGIQILNSHIEDELEAGHHVVVGGVSQSATINALEMRDIVDGSLTVNGEEGYQPDPDELQFLNLGDPSNPNGGLLARFDLPQLDDHPSIPSLGITFSGAAPADTGMPADIYTNEYDGFADFPQYPLNLVSDLNALAGILFVHGQYIEGLLGDDIGKTPEEIANAIELDTSDGYDGGTTYYMMPTDQLPLAQLIEEIGGKPLADLLEPDLKVLSNLGYGADPEQGWSDGPADEATPIGIAPDIDADQFSTILQSLVDGARQGFNDFIDDLSDPSSWESGDDAADGSDSVDLNDAPSLTDVVNAFTDAASQAYATLLPTADIINALTTTLPTYDLDIFTGALQEGDLLDAIGLPAAATVGLLVMAGGIELITLGETIPDIQDTLDIF